VTTITDIINLRKKYEEELSKIGQEDFTELAEAVFTANPSINAIGWYQHTGYYKDGDACVFGVSNIMLRFEDDMNEDFEDDEFGCLYGDRKFYDAWGRAYQKFPNDDNKRGQLQAQFLKIVSPFSEIPDDVYETVFGDHVSVVILRDGTVQVTEYNHD